jgi:hypothetical protein
LLFCLCNFLAGAEKQAVRKRSGGIFNQDGHIVFLNEVRPVRAQKRVQRPDLT